MSITFAICATLSVTGALGMLLSKRAVHSALFVALTMINLAVLYLQLSAPFLGMVQIIVYTGAVMMLFLFVLMIVGVDSSDSLTETLKGQRVTAIAVAVALGLLLTTSIGSAVIATDTQLDTVLAGGNVQAIANLMFSKYVLALEVTAALLVTAAVGAMVLAHRERITPKLSQREQQKARFADYALTGKHPGPLPSSGVYARHNAVDTPALLPDGSISTISVPAPLQTRGSVRDINEEDAQQIVDLTQGNTVIEGGQDGRN
jgi:NADH-quinone oxidoreductase subunit J